MRGKGGSDADRDWVGSVEQSRGPRSPPSCAKSTAFVNRSLGPAGYENQMNYNCCRRDQRRTALWPARSAHDGTTDVSPSQHDLRVGIGTDQIAAVFE